MSPTSNSPENSERPSQDSNENFSKERSPAGRVSKGIIPDKEFEIDVDLSGNPLDLVVASNDPIAELPPFGVELDDPDVIGGLIDGGIGDITDDVDVVKTTVTDLTRSILNTVLGDIDTVKSKLNSFLIRSASGIKTDIDESFNRIKDTADLMTVETAKLIAPVVQKLGRDVLSSGLTQGELFGIGLVEQLTGVTTKTSIGVPEIPPIFDPGLERPKTNGDEFSRMMGCVPPIGTKDNPQDLIGVKFDVGSASFLWPENPIGLSHLEMLDIALAQSICAVTVLESRGELTDEYVESVFPGRGVTREDVIEVAINAPHLWCKPCGGTNGDTVPVDEDDCKDAIKIEICNIKELCECIDDSTGNGEDPGKERKPSVAWYNCKTRETTLRIPRDAPEGDDWERAGSIQETVNKLMECICEAIEDGGTIDEDAFKFFTDSEVDEGPGLPECTLPPFAAINPNMIELLKNFILSEGILLASLNLVGGIEIFGTKIVEAPGWGLIVALLVLWMSLSIAQSTWKTDPCYGQKGLRAVVTRTYLMFWERLTPGAFDEQLVAATQAVRFYCPKTIPNQQQANNAYLTDVISLDKWRCWTRGNGNEDSRMGDVVFGQRSKLNVGELLAAWHRNVINDTEFDTGLRELGYLDDHIGGILNEISKQLPGISDIIHFMVRDTEDPDIVDRFKLQADFGKKFTGDLKRWTEEQNIPVEVMEKAWIAHWRYPGFRQLMEMFHRFRNLPVGDPRRTTEEDVRVALRADDVPEFWIDRLLGISFRVLTRVDVRRAFTFASRSPCSSAASSEPRSMTATASSGS